MGEVTTTAIVVMTTIGCGFLSLLATLVFLWKVYKRGGRHDLTAAARALRETRRLAIPPLPNTGRHRAADGEDGPRRRARRPRRRREADGRQQIEAVAAPPRRHRDDVL